MVFYAQLIIALMLDALVGDPRRLPHPVRFIGWLCERYEQLLRRAEKIVPLVLLGSVAFFLVLLTTLCSAWLVLLLLGSFSRFAVLGGALLLLYFCLASGDLAAHSRVVYGHLQADDLSSARRAVSLIVGRDTENLDRSSIARACIESVAENLVDGITAPLFWALIASMISEIYGGDPLIPAALGAICYKAVNTMDSMYGYRNERYLQFGRCAARVDDYCNFLPARLSGFCVVAAAGILRYDAASAYRVFVEDRKKSSSPNSGHTEAAVAGALNVQLGGPADYFGHTHDKPLIGATMRIAEPADIVKTNRLVVAAAWLFLFFGIALHLAITWRPA